MKNPIALLTSLFVTILATNAFEFDIDGNVNTSTTPSFCKLDNECEKAKFTCDVFPLKSECKLHCSGGHSCSASIVHCGSHHDCSVLCDGADSCNGLIIASPNVKLTCSGDGACIDVQFKASLDTFTDNGRYEIGQNYIAKRNALTGHIIDMIKSERDYCMEKPYDREKILSFGGGPTAKGRFHSINMNDCISPILYGYIKQQMLKTSLYLHDAIKHGKRKDFSGRGFIDHEWFLSHVKSNIDTRMISYLSYNAGGSLGWHKDVGSAFTVGMILSDSFQGGDLEIRSNDDDDIEKVSLSKGDLIWFDSRNKHRVLPVKSGKRDVLYTEWWYLPKNGMIGRQDAHTAKRWIDQLPVAL